jgi:dihydropteroate synthase
MRDRALSQPVNLDFLHTKGRVWIMGVLNATPDSFYADSRTLDPLDAAAKAEQMIEQGAAILDIGGESTRPGSAPVPASVELDRVLPVIDAIHQRFPATPLSIDTQKADVARQAAAHGVTLINDVSALKGDPQMAEVAAQTGCYLILMHMRGIPATMQQNPYYEDVIDELTVFFKERIQTAVKAGVARDRIILDPGIGFGKTVDHNLLILKNLAMFQSLASPLLVGISRKSFLAKLLSDDPSQLPPADRRLAATLAASLCAVQNGAAGLRTHDVGVTAEAVRVWQNLH